MCKNPSLYVVRCVGTLAMLHTCEVKGDLTEEGFLLLSCGAWGLNSGLQSLWQAPIPTKPSHSLYLYFFNLCIFFSAKRGWDGKAEGERSPRTCSWPPPHHFTQNFLVYKELSQHFLPPGITTPIQDSHSLVHFLCFDLWCWGSWALGMLGLSYQSHSSPSVLTQ